jgi:hypothetical protein
MIHLETLNTCTKGKTKRNILTRGLGAESKLQVASGIVQTVSRFHVIRVDVPEPPDSSSANGLEK